MIHKVSQGECLASIASRYRTRWKDIWEHSQNEHLRNKKREPGMLCPGDMVFIPDRGGRFEPVATGERHTFAVDTEKTMLHIRLTVSMESLPNEPYTLRIGTGIVRGETDSEGILSASVPADASEIVLVLPKRAQSYKLILGGLAPVDTETGAILRLQNLRMSDGEKGRLSARDLKHALRIFQRAHKLTESGELDEPTVCHLRQVHGC